MRTIVIATVLASFIGGCKDKSESRPAADDPPTAPARDGDGPTKAKPKAKTPNLIDSVEMKAFGDQPGYLEDGLVYFAVNVGEAQRYWDSLPKPDDIEREGMQAQREVGFNPVADNWAKFFAVDEDAVVSATVLRPMDTDVAPLRKALADLRGGARPTEDEAWKKALASMAYHSRAHVPSDDPDATLKAMVGLFDDRDRERGAEACTDLKFDRCVASSSGELIGARKLRDAVVLDFVFFEHGEYKLRELGMIGPDESALPRIPDRRAVVERALAAKTSVVPHAGDIAGDAAMWLNPNPLARLAALDRVGRAVRESSYDEYDGPKQALARLERIESLTKATRLFPGLALSFDYVDDDLHATALWPVAGALWGRMAVRSVETKASAVPVPTAKALCDGALACFRTQALPDSRPLAKTLLSAGFGKDIEELVRALERDEEYTWTLLAAGAWPNLIAAMLAAPESLDGAEAGIARTARDAVLRADGFGGVLRSYSLGGYFDLTADYSVYARAAKKDVDAAKGLLGLSGQEVKDVELPDEQGRATSLQLSRRPAASAFLKSEDGEFAWAALAPDAGAFAKLLQMDSETPAGPMAYLEFTDLWRLFSPVGGTELAFARLWARGRRLQFVLELDDGAPRVRGRLGK